MGEGSRYIVYDPLIQTKDGMTEITQLRIRARGKRASKKTIQIALRQSQGGWQRLIKLVGSDGDWKCSIERTGEPYSLSLAIVSEDPSISFEITASDEFGRQALPLTVESAK
jgi:hypothetical protein